MAFVAFINGGTNLCNSYKFNDVLAILSNSWSNLIDHVYKLRDKVAISLFIFGNLHFFNGILVKLLKKLP
jgi:hypothetical protein